MIQVVNRAFDILEYVASDPGRPIGLGEIAAAVNLNQGTCANIIKTMVARRYLDQVGAKKGYCLGAKAFQLTGNTAYRKDILEAARGEMERLTRHLDESCLLAVLQGDQRVIIHRVLCDQPLQVQTADEKHAYDAASGRLLVAMLSDGELEKFVGKYGLPAAAVWPEASTSPKLKEQVEKIRATGYAWQESQRQVVGYALPIRRRDEVVASLSVYLPAYRQKLIPAPDLLAALRQAGSRISQNLA